MHIDTTTCPACLAALADISWPVPGSSTMEGWAGHHTFYVFPAARIGITREVPACTAYALALAKGEK